ncbi:MAG: hypothetical protein ABGX22_17380, partial [Pirellulaceae bacterium]
MTKDAADREKVNHTSDAVAGRGLGNLWIETDVVIFQRDLPAAGIVAGYPITPIIAVASVLRHASGRFELASVRLNAQIEATELKFLSSPSRAESP